jgi:hypothetical protein
MTNETARISAYRGSPELLTLTAVAGLALTVGLVVLSMGVVDTSPGWDDAWDEEARRAAQVVWGAGIAGLGAIAAIGALVLAGVKRELARTTDETPRRHTEL